MYNVNFCNNKMWFYDFQNIKNHGPLKGMGCHGVKKKCRDGVQKQNYRNCVPVQILMDMDIYLTCAI